MTTPPFTVRELQAAADALLTGAFATEQPAHTASGADPTAVWTPEGGPLVRVTAGHSGAGASTMALAVADAAADIGLPVRLVDAASPAWSGLVSATDTELGTRGGWRRGRRSPRVIVDRLADPHARTPVQVPPPPACGEPLPGLTVLDTGWSARELAAHPSWLTLTPGIEVVVTAATDSGFSQTEARLAAVEETAGGLEAVLVCVTGISRWAGPVVETAGPRLRRIAAADGICFWPHLRTRPPAPGPGPQPKPLTKAAADLVRRIEELTDPLPPATHHHEEGP